MPGTKPAAKDALENFTEEWVVAPYGSVELSAVGVAEFWLETDAVVGELELTSVDVLYVVVLEGATELELVAGDALCA